MSLSPKDREKLFEAKKLARGVMRQAEQGFVAAGAAIANDHAFSKDELETIERFVERFTGKMYERVKEARADGYTRVQLHAYNVTNLSGANVHVHRAGCERMMAAINANPELHAWVELTSDRSECRLMLDFSRLYARALDASVLLDDLSSD